MKTAIVNSVCWIHTFVYYAAYNIDHGNTIRLIRLLVFSSVFSVNLKSIADLL